jgi:hypothetical protein
MKMMGYTGGGLGATGEGRLEPVQVGRLEENEGVRIFRIFALHLVLTDNLARIQIEQK